MCVVHDANDDVDIRDYLPSVPANQINWRASAKFPKLKANYGFGGQQSTPLVEVDMDELIKRVQTYNLPDTIDLIFDLKWENN